MNTTHTLRTCREPMAHLAEALLCVHEEAEDDSDIAKYMPRTSREDEEEPERGLYGNY